MNADLQSEFLTIVSSDESLCTDLRNKVLCEKCLKKLKDSEYISVFFLLMDFIPEDYSSLLKKEILDKEKILSQIIWNHPHSESLLVEILGTIKRYDLLKRLNMCCHKFINKAASLNNIDKLWKALYEISEIVDLKENLNCIEALFPGQEKTEQHYLEISLAEAYKNKLFSKKDLLYLHNTFKEIPAVIAKLKILDGYYPISSHPCGLAVIINHETFHSDDSSDPKLRKREDSHLDVADLEKLWKDYGFEVQVHKNLDDQSIMSLFQNLAKQDHSAYDIFVTCYMSHGNRGVVYSSNCKAILISDLIDLIANDCPTLNNKPKLFFIQACQGTKIQRGISFPSKDAKKQDDDSKYEIINQANIPLNSDCLKVVSSIPGYTSFVSKGKNSWFIESLVKNIRRYGNELPIYDIIVNVNNEVSKKDGTLTSDIDNCKQTVHTESTLRRKLQLKKYLPK